MAKALTIRRVEDVVANASWFRLTVELSRKVKGLEVGLIEGWTFPRPKHYELLVEPDNPKLLHITATKVDHVLEGLMFLKADYGLEAMAQAAVARLSEIDELERRAVELIADAD